MLMPRFNPRIFTSESLEEETPTSACFEALQSTLMCNKGSEPLLFKKCYWCFTNESDVCGLFLIKLFYQVNNIFFPCIYWSNHFFPAFVKVGNYIDKIFLMRNHLLIWELKLRSVIHFMSIFVYGMRYSQMSFSCL